MKAWIKTNLYFVDEETGYLPDLAGYETDRQHLPIIPMMKINFPDELLIRLASTPDVVQAITNKKTQLTDGEARTEIQKLHPNSDVENVDAKDPEIDEIAKSEGLDPDLRTDIVIPTAGKQVLQDQESYLMEHICKRAGLTDSELDNEAKNKGKWSNRKEMEDDIKHGRTEAHEFVLSRIREKHQGLSQNKELHSKT